MKASDWISVKDKFPKIVECVPCNLQPATLQQQLAALNPSTLQPFNSRRLSTNQPFNSSSAALNQ